MAQVEKEKVVKIFQILQDCDQRIKDVQEEKKETIEEFCVQNEVSKKAFAAVYRKFLARMKDRAKEFQESSEIEELETVVFGDS